jgi:hypothetical protein
MKNESGTKIVEVDCTVLRLPCCSYLENVSLIEFKSVAKRCGEDGKKTTKTMHVVACKFK